MTQASELPQALDLGESPVWLSQMQIRQLRREDLPALEWEGAYRHFRRLYEQAYRRSLRGNAVLWVADHFERGILGQLFVLLRNELNLAAADGRRRAFIHSFRIRPKYRSCGLGSRLLQWAEEDLLRRKFRWASLNVALDNPKAIRFYERWGYARVAHEPGNWSYVDHRGVARQVHEPSWRMRKDLRGTR